MNARPAALCLLMLTTVAAACGEAATTIDARTAAPQLTGSANAGPSPARTSTPTDLPSSNPTATPPSAALPICQQPSQVELDQLTLAFAAYWDGDGEIYLVQADGSGLVQLTDNTTDETGPNWSPDGRQLAFVSDLDQTPKFVVSDADGSNAAIVATGLEVSFDLVWSPTGRRIVFRRVNDLVAVDVLTDVEVNLTLRRPFLGPGLPSFAPEGDRMVLVGVMPDSAGPPSRRLFTVRADGTDLTELSFPLGDANWPTWHPVHDEILFEGLVPGEGVGLYVATLDGSIRKLEADLGNSVPLPSWSPDGTMIAYAALELGPGSPERPLQSFHVATESEEVDEVVLGPEAGAERGVGIYRYFWAPDSRHIAYTITNEARGFGTADVYVFDICEGTPLLVVEAVSQFSDVSWRPLPER